MRSPLDVPEFANVVPANCRFAARILTEADGSPSSSVLVGQSGLAELRNLAARARINDRCSGQATT